MAYRVTMRFRYKDVIYEEGTHVPFKKEDADYLLSKELIDFDIIDIPEKKAVSEPASEKKVIKKP